MIFSESVLGYTVRIVYLPSSHLFVGAVEIMDIKSCLLSFISYLILRLIGLDFRFSIIIFPKLLTQFTPILKICTGNTIDIPALPIQNFNFIKSCNHVYYKLNIWLIYFIVNVPQVIEIWTWKKADKSKSQNKLLL